MGEINELNGKPLETILGELGSPASREDIQRLRSLIEEIEIKVRSACIEKVREMKRDWLTHFKQTNKPEYFTIAEAADEIATKLESVTIQEQKS